MSQQGLYTLTVEFPTGGPGSSARGEVTKDVAYLTATQMMEQAFERGANKATIKRQGAQQ